MEGTIFNIQIPMLLTGCAKCRLQERRMSGEQAFLELNQDLEHNGKNCAVWYPAQGA
jgi:hypothetical protein